MDLVHYIKKGYKNKVVRKLKDMPSFFSDKKAVQKLLEKNPLIYVVYEKIECDVSYSLTVMEPGRIGEEFYMTKGHCHQVPSPELIHVTEGKGVLVVQDKGDAKKINLKKGIIYIIPKDCIHRVANIRKERLSFICVYTTKAGHDYSLVEKEGFKIIVK